jgi:hypothetical protein
MYAAILLFHTLTIRAALLSYIFLGLGAGFAFSLDRNVSTRKIYWTAVLAAVSAYLIIITASIIAPQKGVELPFQDTELSSKVRGATNPFGLGLFPFASLVFGLVTVAGSLAAERLQTTLRSFSSGADTADVHGDFTRLQEGHDVLVRSASFRTEVKDVVAMFGSKARQSFLYLRGE